MTADVARRAVHRPAEPTVIEGLRVLIVAGIPIGVLIGGIGSRLAMLLLRVTSSDRVIGVTSDDGFTIGRITIGGTYNLMMLGAALGVVGAALYQWVAPWLIGPVWLRRCTVGLACGAVIGSMLIHADGVDFTLLTPRWLAVTAFVAVPALFGVGVGIAVDYERNRQPVRTRPAWVLPVVLVAAFPVTLVALAPATIVLGIWQTIRQSGLVKRLANSPGCALAVRAAWLAIALLGLRALLGDLSDLGAL